MLHCFNLLKIAREFNNVIFFKRTTNLIMVLRWISSDIAFLADAE